MKNLRHFQKHQKIIVVEKLLSIIKRRRYRDFCLFKMCLHDTLQHKLADILEKGGIGYRACETE